MKYGAMNFPVKPVLEEIQRISDLGFDYVELALDPPCAHWEIIRGHYCPKTDFRSKKYCRNSPCEIMVVATKQ